MELYQLQYFIQVAKLESISAAARSLNISQPALSRSISHLERELSTQLFDRNSKRVRLNKTGEQFLREVEKSLAILNDAAQRAKNSDQIDGSVSVCCFGPQSEASACIYDSRLIIREVPDARRRVCMTPAFDRAESR